jgi:hypothetical protein
MAIRLNGYTAATISNNTLTTGTTSTGSNQIIETGTTVGATTVTNNIMSGTSGGNVSQGMYFNNGSFNVSGNTINSPGCSTANCNTYGLNLASGTPFTITNNSIVAGTCTGSNCSQSGIRLAGTSVLTITGNTVDSGVTSNNTVNRYAVFSDYCTQCWSSGSVIKRNTFINRSGIGSATTVSLTNTSPNANSLQFCSNLLIGGDIPSGANNSTVLAFSNATNTTNSIVGNTFIGASIASGVV